jgi:hypothetical protein
MSLRWILPLSAAAFVGAALWIHSPRHRVSPEVRLEAARALLAAKPPDTSLALRELDEALRLTNAPKDAALRAAILRERARTYAARGLEELALADCRAELEGFGPHAETLARAADLALALNEPTLALGYAEQLAALAPARGQGRIGRARLALADAPLAAVERLARSSLPSPESASAITLAQRAAVFADQPNTSSVALEDLYERFPRSEERRRVGEWVREASEHLALAGAAFAQSLRGSTGDSVAGLQDLLLRGGATRAAADLGWAALAQPKLESPMPVLARTAGALAALGRLEAARALVLDFARRNPGAVRPQELTNLEIGNELVGWGLLCERLGLWGELAAAGWELLARESEDRAAFELGHFWIASAELAGERPASALTFLNAIGPNPIDQHDLGVRIGLARAAAARREGDRALERFALLSATKAAEPDVRREPLRADLGRAWQRLHELQLDEGDLVAAEVSLTHALRYSAARASELLPLWHELGKKSLASRGTSSPYLVYTRAKGYDDRGEAAPALTAAQDLLDDYPGLGPALDVLARAANKLSDHPRLIAAALELLERGWPESGASARLRAVPKEYFLPQDRVRWLLLDPRGSLEDFVRRLLAQGDVVGASQAARGGPARYQPPELLPLLARVELAAGESNAAIQTLELLPADSAPFREATGLALRSAVERLVEGGQPQGLASMLAKVLASGRAEDPELLSACDLLMALGRLDEAQALLAWMEDGPFLGPRLLRLALARALADASPRSDDDLERAAALLDDGRPELGRLVLALERGDTNALAREARAALASPLAHAGAVLAALHTLAGEPERARDELGDAPTDGRDFLRELVLAALDDGAGAADADAPALSASLRELLGRERLLVLALAAEHAPWNTWMLYEARALPEPLRADPWLRGLAARALLGVDQVHLALEALGPPSTVARLEWLRAELLRRRGAPPARVLAAELAWFTATGGEGGYETGDEPRRSVLAAEARLAAGDPAGARTVLEQALAAAPDEPHLLARVAELLDAPGTRVRAFEVYARLLALASPRSDDPLVPRVLATLRRARDEGEMSESRWWAEVEALEAERPDDPCLPRELATRSLERPLVAREQARTHALHRLERFQRRTLGRALEPLRAGETGRWTELLARVSPERALAFASEELLRDPSDPALWRASANGLLGAGRWQEALARLEALQKVAPERETGRLLALTSYRYERNARVFAERLEEIRRFDPHALDDAALSFYEGLSHTLSAAPKPVSKKEKKAAEGPEPDAAAFGLERALALWEARASNGLEDAEHGRDLALALFQAGRREPALVVLETCASLAESRLERDLFAALQHLVASAPAQPKRIEDVPLPPRLEGAGFDDEPGRARPNAGAERPKAGDKKQVPRPGAAGAGGQRATPAEGPPK